MMKFNSTLLILFLFLFLFACKKEQLLNPDQSKVAMLQIKGFVIADTLEFVLNGKVIGKAIDNQFDIKQDHFNENEKIIIRKKTGRQEVGNIVVAGNPYNQLRKIFYDGSIVQDNIVLTPVTDPNNMGFRLRFSTAFPDFYGGPVDIEFFEYINKTTTPRSSSTTSVRIIKNITASFGDFIELPSILPVVAGTSKTYRFKVYKAGTKDLPYNSMTNVFISDPVINYGSFSVTFFKAGTSKLISISPTSIINNGTITIGDGYSAQDFSSAFQ